METFLFDEPSWYTVEALAYELSEGLVLVRPDGYIALITSAADAIDRYFDQFR